MKKLSIAVFATAALMCAGSAFAEQAAMAPASAAASAPAAAAAPAAPAAKPVTPAAATTAEAAPDPNEVICESEAPPTGSLLGGARICRTRHQWSEQERQTTVGQDLHHETTGSMLSQ
jgi:invasion protein IalB